MQRVDFGRGRARDIARYESVSAASVRIGHGIGQAHVHGIHFEPGGYIGPHPAGFAQLFLVVAGSGWAAGADGVRMPLAAHQGVYIACGEVHAQGSDAGMTAIIVQIAQMAPDAAALAAEPDGGIAAPSLRLTDGAVLLRPWADDDAPRLFAAARASIAAVGPWMSWLHAGYALRDAEEWIRRCHDGWAADADREFGIFDPATGDVWGAVGINQRNRVHGFANLGYWVRAGLWGRGIATAAARLAAAHAIDALSLARLEIVVRVDNAASRRVAEKAGAVLEGIARHRIATGGGATVAGAIYSLVPDDLRR
jgi:RimJ/RimL family protein N-acetyltransferase